jgi:hypothetical protein
MARGEVGPGEHRGQSGEDEALAAPSPLEGCHGLPEAVDRLPVVALGLVSRAEALVRHSQQADLPAGRGERQGALSGGDGLGIGAHAVERV